MTVKHLLAGFEFGENAKFYGSQKCYGVISSYDINCLSIVARFPLNR